MSFWGPTSLSRQKKHFKSRPGSARPWRRSARPAQGPGWGSSAEVSCLGCKKQLQNGAMLGQKPLECFGRTSQNGFLRVYVSLLCHAVLKNGKYYWMILNGIDPPRWAARVPFATLTDGGKQHVDTNEGAKWCRVLPLSLGWPFTCILHSYFGWGNFGFTWMYLRDWRIHCWRRLYSGRFHLDSSEPWTQQCGYRHWAIIIPPVTEDPFCWGYNKLG